jgi:hypothetical protein
MENKRSGLPTSNALRTNATAAANQLNKNRPAQQQINSLEFDEARETLDCK